MITEKLRTKEEVKEQIEIAKYFTTKELVDYMVSCAEEKYCPEVKGNCKGHKCAMFVVDKPWTDPRYIEARCTFAGKRPLVCIDGETKDFDPEVWR